MANTLELCMGLQASGKSTYAREKVRNDPSWMRMNSDEWRASMTDGHFYRSRENILQEAQRQAALSILESGINVIVDNTNLNESTRNRWAEIAKQAGANFKITKFNVPVAECVRRDALRSGSACVGRHVIEMTALRNGFIMFDRPVILVDVDGTLADSSKRVDMFLRRSPKDWDGFFAHTQYDLPREDVLALLRSKQAEFPNAITCVVTARKEMCGKETTQWLDKHNIKYDHLFVVRRDDDYREDSILKEQLLKFIPAKQIVCVIDDRPRVIRMWQNHGINVINVGNGKEF